MSTSIKLIVTIIILIIITSIWIVYSRKKAINQTIQNPKTTGEKIISTSYKLAG
ncbi:hypothetical protein J4436_00045 [Candidatus Woesearchaeota archaeon]|nr:hypothetical protein [Candidatus Woesearchaeota archaeon]